MADENLEERVRQLERREHRYRLVLAGIGLAVLACGVLWVLMLSTGRAQAQKAAEAAKVVRAREFILEDDKGKSRLELTITDTGVALGIFDENGESRAALDVSKDGPALGLFGPNGNPSAMLDVGKVGPGLSLWDREGRPRVVLVCAPAGPALTFYDTTGRKAWSAP